MQRVCQYPNLYLFIYCINATYAIGIIIYLNQSFLHDLGKQTYSYFFQPVVPGQMHLKMAMSQSRQIHISGTAIQAEMIFIKIEYDIERLGTMTHDDNNFNSNC